MAQLRRTLLLVTAIAALVTRPIFAQDVLDPSIFTPAPVPTAPTTPSDCDDWLKHNGYKIANLAHREDPSIGNDSIRGRIATQIRPCVAHFDLATTSRDQWLILGRLLLLVGEQREAHRVFHQIATDTSDSEEDRANRLAQIISIYLSIPDSGVVYAESYLPALDSLPSATARFQALGIRAELMGIYTYGSFDDRREVMARQMRSLAMTLPSDLQRLSHLTVSDIYRTLAECYANRLQDDSARAVIAAAPRDFPRLVDLLSHDLAPDSVRYAMIGRPAPEISADTWLTRATHVTVPGKATVLMFTADGCVLCRPAYGTLRALDSTWHAQGLQIVFAVDLQGFADGKPATRAREIDWDREYFVARNKFTNPIALQHTVPAAASRVMPMSPNRSLYYAESWRPEFVVIDKSGVVRAILRDWDPYGNRARALTAVVASVMRTPQ